MDMAGTTKRIRRICDLPRSRRKRGAWVWVFGQVPTLSLPGIIDGATGSSPHRLPQVWMMVHSSARRSRRRERNVSAKRGSDPRTANNIQSRTKRQTDDLGAIEEVSNVGAWFI